MVRSRIVSLSILAAALPALLLAGDPPRFSEYPAHSAFHGDPAPPHFRAGEDGGRDTPGHGRHSILVEADHGPNFAGRFTFVSWTCGSGCARIAVVDAATGRIFRHMPFETLIQPDLRQDIKPFSFRMDSRLLIAQGYFDIDTPRRHSPCSRRAYLWTGKAFRLLRTTPLACVPQP